MWPTSLRVWGQGGLGIISDVIGFEEIMENAAMPSIPKRQKCQHWVRNVSEDAIAADVLSTLGLLGKSKLVVQSSRGTGQYT